MESIRLEKISEYVKSGLINENKHPVNPDIRIYNYTHECQFDRKWDEVTTTCRGLIMNVLSGKILARPFEKFFNLQEHLDVYKKELPSEEPIVTEKLDGSLGILYWINDTPWISTRGSFESEQALWATAWFRKNVDYSNLPKDITLLFEIIYNENRIVVNYDFEGLVYLAGIDTKTGRQVSYRPEDKNAPVVKQIKNTDIKTLTELDNKEGEGFVVFYPKANLRLKIKFPEYVRLHKILTCLSVKGIWEYMKANGVDTDIRKIAEDAPDEFYDWIDTVASDLSSKYKEIENICVADYGEIEKKAVEDLAESIDNLWLRKDWALEITNKKYPGILFSILDERDYRHLIWKLVKPKATKTFKEEL